MARVFIVLILAGVIPTQVAPAEERILVANLLGHTAELVDPINLRTLATTPVGQQPMTVAVTPDRRFGLVASQGFFAGPLSNGSLINYSTEEDRRVDLVFGIGYGDDIAAARAVILKIIEEDARIYRDPEPQIVISALADSSVNFAVRVWAKGEDYWDIFFHLQESVKTSFDQNGISIPFPQMDVHSHKVA